MGWFSKTVAKVLGSERRAKSPKPPSEASSKSKLKEAIKSISGYRAQEEVLKPKPAGTPVTRGWAPPSPEESPQPYAHLTSMQSGETTTGFGISPIQDPAVGDIDAMNANVTFSRNPFLTKQAAPVLNLLGPAAGFAETNFEADAQMFKMKTPEEKATQLELGLMTASAQKKIDEKGAAVGADASVVSGAIRVGQLDESRQDDEQLRVGLSYGAGGGGRVHWDDADGDGAREFGIGFDAGPVSADIKTEKPLKTLRKIRNYNPATAPGYWAYRGAKWLKDKARG